MPTEIPILLSQAGSISIVDSHASSSSSRFAELVSSPTSRRKNSNSNAGALPDLTSSNNLPSDWNELLKLRRQYMKKEEQQQQQPIQIEPANFPPQNQHEMINGLPAILLRTDALYQKYTWDKSPIIIEKYKLVFFTVPKVGCTEFKKLFRRMMGHSNWRDHQYYSEPFLPHNPHTNGLKYLSDYPFEQANEMLTSPDWTRAIFIRKPEERALSCYLDKSALSKGYYLRMRCCERFSPGTEQYNLLQCATGTKQYTAPEPGEQNIPIMTFEDFMSKILPHCNDPHWEAQATRMAPKYWERISFVGHFENLHQDTKRLLVQIGAWEDYGASGWVVDGVDGEIFDPKHKAFHGTKARDQGSKAKYFTPQVIESIQKYYYGDYHHPIMHFDPPTAQQQG